MVRFILIDALIQQERYFNETFRKLRKTNLAHDLTNCQSKLRMHWLLQNFLLCIYTIFQEEKCHLKQVA